MGPSILEPTLVTRYPFESPPLASSGNMSTFKERLDHGRAEAQDVAREHP